MQSTGFHSLSHSLKFRIYYKYIGHNEDLNVKTLFLFHPLCLFKSICMLMGEWRLIGFPTTSLSLICHPLFSPASLSSPPFIILNDRRLGSILFTVQQLTSDPHFLGALNIRRIWTKLLCLDCRFCTIIKCSSCWLYCGYKLLFWCKPDFFLIVWRKESIRNF